MTRQRCAPTRRESCGAAWLWPASACSPGVVPSPMPRQQPARVHRIGYLAGGRRAPRPKDFAAFQQGMATWATSRVRNSASSAAGHQRPVRRAVAQLVGLQPTVILVPDVSRGARSRPKTTTIPIVMAAWAISDGGLAASLARPGGNVTGLSTPVLARSSWSSSRRQCRRSREWQS